MDRGGSKLSLTRSPDGDVLKAIIIKLQKRVKAGASTLLIKVKGHRGDPLNEEADIRAEIDRLKEEGEKKSMGNPNRSNNLPMVRTIED